ncbi:MAG: DUF2130 domain-containing protein [Burkholderiaceae bacterium]
MPAVPESARKPANATEPMIQCPNCDTQIPISESLAAPLIAQRTREFEARIAGLRAQIESRESQLRDERDALSRQREALDEELRKRLAQERESIIQSEARKARAAIELDLQNRDRELKAAQALIAERDRKLAQAQEAQAQVLKKERELDDQRRELALTVENRVRAELQAEREKARRELESGWSLRLQEREQVIQSLQSRIEDLQRRAEQGSQQMQGEVQELALEQMLASRFPLDLIEPVPKGEFGGDALQRVHGPSGTVCGTILWESKRTKHWQDGWLVKLRDDQRSARAEVAVIVSHALPREIDSFDLIDHVWVVHPSVALPLAMSLRQSLIELATARRALEGKQEKSALIYDYLTGPRFKHRVQAIVESFSQMQEDLDRERKAIMKQWSKRQMQLERMMQATVGMVGDMQGIAGASMQDIEGLDVRFLEDDSDGPI